MLRDVLRAILEDHPALVVASERGAGVGERIVAHVVCGERERAGTVAQAIAGDVPVVVVSPDGRWAGRYAGGRLEREVEDVSPEGMRGLVVG